MELAFVFIFYYRYVRPCKLLVMNANGPAV